MQKQQTIINRHKEASDARTSKASHLKVVPSKRNTSMNNNTVTQQNNQYQQDAWGLAYEASRVAKIVNKSAYAIRAIGDVLETDLCNKDCDNDSLNNNVIGGLITEIKLLSYTLDDGGNALGDTLVKGGFNHE